MDVRPQHTFEPARLFEVLLPAWLRNKGEALRSAQGVVQFHLVTHAGQQSWFLTADPGGVHSGDHGTPDVTITLDGDVVVPMLLGELDVEAAVDRGEVHVGGSAAVLEQWVQLFNGDQSLLDILGSRRVDP